ncbi:MAG: SDR family oxidoreductase, partial [Rhizobiaceae bacterium]
MVDQDKPVLLITGASSGIGEAATKRFAAAGYNVVAVARRKEMLDKLAADLSGQAEVIPFATSVAEDGVAEKATALCLDRFGRLDVLINNAGSFEGIPVHDTTDEQLDDLIGVSIRAPFRFSREAVKVMKPGSSVIHIGSTYGVIGGFNGGAYSVAKAGLVGLTTTMAGQYGRQGIRTNMIAPGVIRTAMCDSFWEMDFFQRLNQEMTPIGRDCTVDDVVNAAFFLASREGSFINGQSLA